MTGEQTYLYTVDLAEQGLRLDALVPARSPHLSRNACARLIRQGLVTVDGETKKPSFTLKSGQVVSVTEPEPETSEVLAQDIALDVLFEDADLIVINKPSGMVVHPAPGHSRDTLVNALMAHCTDLSGVGGVQRPGIVHRLDKDTSGVLVVAKNDASHQELSRQFSDRTMTKIYLVLVHGMVKEDSGSIALPIGRHPEDRKRMYAAPPAKGREALTLWRVLERFAGASLLRVELKTGRTHQIRVHLAAIHHPVIGDPVYGGRKIRGRLPSSVLGKTPKVQRQMLHSHSLTFCHPASGKEITCKAPLPRDMMELKEALAQTIHD